MVSKMVSNIDSGYLAVQDAGKDALINELNVPVPPEPRSSSLTAAAATVRGTCMALEMPTKAGRPTLARAHSTVRVPY